MSSKPSCTLDDFLSAFGVDGSEAEEVGEFSHDRTLEEASLWLLLDSAKTRAELYANRERFKRFPTNHSIVQAARKLWNTLV